MIAGEVHTYLDVVDSSGVTHILEGIQGSVLKSIIPGLTYLNASDTPTGGLNIDDPSSDHVDYDSVNTPSLSAATVCADVSTLINVTDNFPTNKVRYSLWGSAFPE